MPDLPDTALSALLQSTSAVWRGRARCVGGVTSRATGFACLDDVLPGGGWPGNGVIEVVMAHSQPPPLFPFFPAIADCTRNGQRVVLVDLPTSIAPFTPAWQQAEIDLSHLLLVESNGRKEAWWVIETALRSQACGWVFAWPCIHGGRLDVAAVRRWQVAAAAGGSLCVVFVPRRAQGYVPNVHLRLQIQGPCVQVLKARGSHQQPIVRL